MASIPTISSRATPAELQRFARAVKNFLDSGEFKLDTTAISKQIDRALRDYEEQTTDLTPPGPPVELVVTGLFDKIMLEWGPATGNVAYYEVFRNMEDDLGNAAMVSPRIGAAMWVDTPPDSSLSATYYYWVRAVSPAGIAGPFNAAAGTPGSTANDPAYLLEVLAGQLGYGQFDVANGVFPVRLWTGANLPALPNAKLWPPGSFIFWNKDDKMYRTVDGQAWSSAVSAEDIVGEIVSTQISDNAITTPKLRANAVSADKLAANSVTAGKIAAGAILADKIGANEVITNTANISNGIITNAKIRDLAVDSAKIADLAVHSAKIANAAITVAKIADAAITTAKIADLAVISAKIATAAITEAKIGNAAVTNAKIANAAITYAKIGDAEVDTLKLAEQAVTIPVASESPNGSASVTYTATGNNVHIIGKAGISAPGAPKNNGTIYGTVSIKYNNTTISYLRYTMPVSDLGGNLFIPITCLHTPTAGSATYEVTITAGSNRGLSFSFTGTSILALEVKR